MRLRTAAICASALGLAASAAPALGSRPASRVDTLPFSLRCTGARQPRTAPVLRGLHARFAVGAGWFTGRGAANPAGGSCGQPYLVLYLPGDAGDCLEQTVYASAAKTDGETPAVFLGASYPILARGRLATVSSMHGIWEEIDEGVTAAHPSYAVEAVYAAANDGTLYELSVVPPPSYAGECSGSGPRARAIARELGQSFRVAPTTHR